MVSFAIVVLGESKKDAAGTMRRKVRDFAINSIELDRLELEVPQDILRRVQIRDKADFPPTSMKMFYGVLLKSPIVVLLFSGQSVGRFGSVRKLAESVVWPNLRLGDYRKVLKDYVPLSMARCLRLEGLRRSKLRLVEWEIPNLGRLQVRAFECDWEKLSSLEKELRKRYVAEPMITKIRIKIPEIRSLVELRRDATGRATNISGPQVFETLEHVLAAAGESI